MVPPRLSVVTLGVRDLARERAFYEALGWTAHGDDEFARFDVGGAALTLYGMGPLVEEAGVEPPGEGFGGSNCAINVDERDDVDRAMDTVHAAGGTVLAEPVDRSWGGRSGYFADPEGHVWEVAWMPGATFDERGALIWPEDTAE